MKFLAKAMLRLAAALAALMLLGVALAVGAVWLTLPGSAVTGRVPELSAVADVTYDADWVPRLRAGSERDAAAALGYLHARDRMFQMDLMRRAASGWLSEIAGPATLPMDRMMRTLGLRRHAMADYTALPDDTRQLLDAYTGGVNAFIAAKGRFAAPEFLLLGAPEPWQPADCLLWAKTMGLWLSMNWRTELLRQGLADSVSPGLMDQLWPGQAGAPGPDAAIAPKARFASAATRLAAVLPSFPDPFTMPRSASNAWAVDGSHTATGAPLLAGDPHLAFGFPSLWYLVRIDLPDGVLAGATSPGVPFLILGHNGKIAWTFTTTGADVQDIFIETPAGQGEYQTPDGPELFAIYEERIAVRGREAEILMVRETRHGPVIGDLGRPDGPVLAVAMANLQPGDTAASGLLALNRASTVQQAGIAAAQIASPVQNLLVADARTIGMFVTGRVPVRKAGDGSAPVPGDGTHDWTGWVSGTQLPHSVSPASGRLVNANEPAWPPDFPVFMGRDTFGDWRARRIRELLSTPHRHTAASFAAMQLDIADPFARQVLPALLALDDAPAELRSWDGSATMESAAPLIFAAWMRAFHDAMLSKAGLSAGLGRPVADFVADALSPAGAHWCGGNCSDLLRQSLATAMRDLRTRYGGDRSAWRWGEAHPAVFAHPLLRAVPLLSRFGTIALPSPGGDTTIDRGGANAAFQSVHGASYRGVYDLAGLDRSLFMMAPGQSGNLFSRHARDFANRWRDGATIPLGPEPATITGTVKLTP